MITYKLKINYQDSKILQSDIEFVSGDVGAYLLECEFYDNGKRVDISSYSVALKAKRADGVILSEGGKIEENKGIISLNNDIYSVPGELYLEIALLGNAKNYITTKIVLANVLEGLGETDETAKDKSSVYVTLLNQIKASVDSANSVLNEAKVTQNEIKETLSNYAVKSTTLSGYGIADAYTKDEIDEITEKKLELWQPKTEYKVGDIVLFQYPTGSTNVDGSDFRISYFMVCIKAHTSSNSLSEADFDYLHEYWTFKQVVNSERALYDHRYNIIAETYATKEEVSANKTALNNKQDKTTIETVLSTNIFDGKIERGNISGWGTPSSYGYQEYYRSINFIKVNTGYKIFSTSNLDSIALYVSYYDADFNYLKSTSHSFSQEDVKKYCRINVTEDVSYIKFYASTTVNPATIDNVQIQIDETVYDFDFYNMHNKEIRLKNTLITTLSFEIPNGSYRGDFISALSFDSGESATSLIYTDSGILNWVGTDCVNFEGLSIFTPSANTHYDIVFYFNGSQFVGIVNGFVPATGNEAVS